MDIQMVTLDGNAVRLEPIRREHWKLLWDVAKDSAEDIFRWIPYPMLTPEALSNGPTRLWRSRRGASRWCLSRWDALRGG